MYPDINTYNKRLNYHAAAISRAHLALPQIEVTTDHRPLQGGLNSGDHQESGMSDIIIQ